MKNFYTQFHKDFVRQMREYFLARIETNKKRGREYKSLEREIFYMTSRLLLPDVKSDVMGIPTKSDKTYDWQKRKDLQ